ncbi:Translation initiation factor 3 subunit J component [Spiromyces aspiralis]|uniref:Translation initiation factor 3 subunit J component n=1 Tax=Spiromyces aspiralis TaxID=68401 RepID=A0ACC1HEZ5_9FUNG|nr:Translation initiation factor 3 subunit J component [Spiromyces aspiralis]
MARLSLSSDDEVPKQPRNKWEDEESDIPDTWEDDEDEDEEEGLEEPEQAENTGEAAVEKKPLPVPKPQPKKKLTLKDKIAKAQEERAKREAEIQQAGGLGDDLSEDEAELVDRRLADRRRQLEADMSNTEDLFSGLTLKDEKNASVLTMNPNTEEEFAEFSKALVEIIQKMQTKKHYKTFLNDFIRALALPLSDVDVRKFASTLTTLANDKQKASRATAKGKKKPNKKVAVKEMPKGQLDTRDYAREAEDDFYEFM